MSQFEFLRHVSFGQYLPTGSAIHKVDPRVKILAYFLLILAITLTPRLSGLVTAFILAVILLYLSKVPFRYALRGVLAPLPFIVLLAILQMFISSQIVSNPKVFTFGVFSISTAGLEVALRFIIRFINLVLFLTLASVTLSTLELVYGLDLLAKPLRNIGIKTNSLSMTVQLMLRFIPLLALSAEKIAKSQASRGGGWDTLRGGVFNRVKQFLPLFVPLFSVNLKQADTLASAMLARGYGSQTTRSGLKEYGFTRWDFLFLLLNALAALVIVALR